MSVTTSLNGHHPRKQLSDQLDRLDGILDVLGEGLSGAVADAVKNGARVAVKEALVEILTNSEFLAAVRGVTSVPDVGMHATAVSMVESERALPPATSAPGLWSRIKSNLAAARSKLRAAMSRAKARIVDSTIGLGIDVISGLSRIRQSVFGRIIAVKRVISTSYTLCVLLKNLKRWAVIAFGVVSLVGILSLVAPQLFAAFTSGLTAALTVMGMQKGIRLPGLTSRLIEKPQKPNV